VSAKSYKTAIVLGSGGHTTEMIRLLGGLELDKFSPRQYIVADSDKMSIQKIKEFEKSTVGSYTIDTLYRSRKVGQNYLSSIFTTLIAIVCAIPLIFRLKPELLLVNGPGTCIPCCLVAWLLRSRIIFVESVCRVKSLSLSGQILYRLKLTETFFVQWSELKRLYPRATYIGRLV